MTWAGPQIQDGIEFALDVLRTTRLGTEKRTRGQRSQAYALSACLQPHSARNPPFDCSLRGSERLTCSSAILWHICQKSGKVPVRQRPL